MRKVSHKRIPSWKNKGDIQRVNFFSIERMHKVFFPALNVILMSVFYYNYRGVGSNMFVCFIIHDFKKTYGVDIIAIAESRIRGQAVEKIFEKLKFDVSFRVKAKSKSGGIWLLWSKIKVDIKVPKSS